MNQFKTLITICWLLIYNIGISFSQIGSIDQSFNTLDINNLGDGSGFDSKVNDMVQQPDGKYVFGGFFLNFNGITASRIVRLNIDGTIDLSFNIGTGFNGGVKALAVQLDGKIIVGGDFTQYNGVTVNHIVRINSNGSIDNSFTSGSAFNASVEDIELLPDGKIMVVGSFTTFKGLNKKSILRMTQDGNLDQFFAVGTGIIGTPLTIEILFNDLVAVGGSFSSYKGVSCNNMAIIGSTGNLVTSVIQGTGFNGAVNAIKQQPDGKILVGGNFSTYDGIQANNLIRLQTNGLIDSQFNVGIGFNAPINEIFYENSNSIIIAGSFTSYNSTVVKSIVKLTNLGLIESNFSLKMEGNQVIEKITKDQNNNLFFVGNFININDKTALRYCKTSTFGTLDTQFFNGSGFSSSVESISIQNDGKIIVSGEFSVFNGQDNKRIVRLNPDGTKDLSFNVGNGFNNTVNKTILQSDEKIIVVGNFSKFDTLAINRFCRLLPNGIYDTTLITGNGFNNEVKDAVIQPDGKIVICGFFTQYNDTLVNRIIRVNSNGSIDHSFSIGTGFNGVVKSIEMQMDGKYIVTGGFSQFNGQVAYQVVRLNSDGTKDPTFNTGLGFNGVTNSSAIQSDGKIIVGGTFTFFDGLNVNRIIRLNTDGSFDATFDFGTGFNGPVNKVRINNFNKIVVGGSFNNYNGVLIDNLVTLNDNGSIENSFMNTSGFNNAVNTFSIQADDKIIVGGQFTKFNSTPHHRFVRLIGQCNNSSAIDEILACNSYTWINGQTYYSNNYSATHSIQNVEGCDSIITLNLTITNVNYQITQTGVTLIANQGNGSYQWVDCDNFNIPIPGETNQWFTPIEDGNYAVLISLNSCSGQSNCFNFSTNSINERSLIFDVFPNPNDGVIRVVTNLINYEINLFNSSGQRVYCIEELSENSQLNFQFLPSGVYYLQLNHEAKTSIIKIVKSY